MNKASLCVADLRIPVYLHRRRERTASSDLTMVSFMGCGWTCTSRNSPQNPGGTRSVPYTRVILKRVKSSLDWRLCHQFGKRNRFHQHPSGSEYLSSGACPERMRVTPLSPDANAPIHTLDSSLRRDHEMTCLQIDLMPNHCLKPTACGTLHARQNPPALARRGLTMRYAVKGFNRRWLRLTN